jgi:hypothetical protein
MDAEKADELGFEMEQGAEIWRARVEIAEGAKEQIEELRDGVLRLGDQFDEFNEIRDELGTEVIGAQADKRLNEDRFAQGVEIAPVAEGVADIVEEKQVKLPGERATGAAGALCDGLETAGGLGKPTDDPTGIAQPGPAQENGGGRGHA